MKMKMVINSIKKFDWYMILETCSAMAKMITMGSCSRAVVQIQEL